MNRRDPVDGIAAGARRTGHAVKRRRVLGLAGAVASGIAPPLLAQLQRRVLGIVAGFPPSNAGAAALWTPFFAELGARGWTVGNNLRLEARYAEGRADRDLAHAEEVLAAQPDVILATSSRAVEALRKFTASVPIVMINVSHAVESGFVASLAHPGGNVTGVSNQAVDMQGKFAELLRAVRPDLQRLGVVWSPSNLGSALGFKDMQAVAGRLGMKLHSLPVEDAPDIEAQLAAALRDRVQALHVHPTLPITAQWRRIQVWAVEHRVITLGQAAWARGGFLMSYWADTAELWRSAAKFVDRILRGAKPAELPVEQPTKFELVINQKTAKAIGVELPRALLLRADEVVE